MRTRHEYLEEEEEQGKREERSGYGTLLLIKTQELVIALDMEQNYSIKYIGNIKVFKGLHNADDDT